MFEYTFWQQAFRWWSDGWKAFFGLSWYPPKCDVAALPADMTRVVESRVIPWPGGYGEVQVRMDFGAELIDQLSLPGLPVQRAHPWQVRRFAMNEPYRGVVRWVDVPVPLAGSYWVEGHPAQGGAYDRHIVQVFDDGRVFEAIQCYPSPRPTVNPDGVGIVTAPTIMSYGLYSPTGVLIDGWPQTAGGVSLAWYAWKPGTGVKRLGLVLNNYGGGDGTKDWDFPRVGQVVRLSEDAYLQEWARATNEDQRNVLTSFRECGAVIYDRGGAENTPAATLSVVAGAQNAHQLRGIDVRLADLELVVD